VKKDMARLHAMAEKHGRNPKELSTTVFRGPMTKEALEAHREAGIDRVLYEVPDAPRDDQLRALDDVVKLMA
jgi:hypothetical protein